MAEHSTLSCFSVLTILTLFWQALVVVCGNDHGSVVSHDPKSFAEYLEINKNFVMFYAPWCGHCKNLAPTWDELGKLYNKEGRTPMIIGKVDCTIHTELCAEQEIIGFPTLKLFLNPTTVKRYAGKRDLDSLRNYVEGHLNAVDPQHEEGEHVEGDEKRPPVPDAKGGLVILTDDNFKDTVSDGFFFIKFYAPWCGHCKRLEPIWDQLADTFKHSDKMSVAKIDCTQSTVICKEYGIRGYPTLLWFSAGEQVNQYQGPRTHEALKKFVADEIIKAGEVPKEEEEEEENASESEIEEDDEVKGEVMELTDENFEEFVATRLVFVKFFAPWCGHCKRLAPTWDDLAKEVINEPVSIAKVDCTQYKSVCDQFQVRGYPTLKIFHEGEKMEDYRGSRSLEDLHAFVKKHLEARHDEL